MTTLAQSIRDTMNLLEAIEQKQEFATKVQAEFKKDAALLANFLKDVKQDPKQLFIKKEELDEDWKKALGTAALAGSLALGAGGAHAGGPDLSGPTQIAQCSGVLSYVAVAKHQNGHEADARAYHDAAYNLKKVAFIMMGPEAKTIADTTFSNILNTASTTTNVNQAAQKLVGQVNTCLQVLNDPNVSFVAQNAPNPF